MSVWALRGLRDGVVTTRWPRRPDDYAEAWRGPATVRPAADAAPGADPFLRADPARSADSSNSASIGAGLERLCPTGAIRLTDRVRIDQGRCILCGHCVDSRPELFAWSAGATGPAAAALVRQALIVPDAVETVDAARAALAARTAALRRSVHIRHVDTGSDGSAEWEIQALLGPVYDVHRLGVSFTASPRHADVLLVTGPGAPGMIGPLRTTFEGMPDPKVVIAVGTDAISGGLLGDHLTGVAVHIPVDIWVPGDPPSPFGILKALLVATGRLR